MAKSSRASSRKANNQRLKANVFGPVEAARAERLSAKLIELASQPKPERSEMKIVDEAEENVDEDVFAAKEDDNIMDVDTAKSTTSSSKLSSKGRIQKRKKKSSKVVFSMYKDKRSLSKRKH